MNYYILETSHRLFELSDEEESVFYDDRTFKRFGRREKFIKCKLWQK